MIKKLILSLIVFSVAILGSLCVSAEDVTFDFDAETGTLKNVYNVQKDEYEIPSEINGVTVRKLVLDWGFSHELNYTKKLIIPETVEDVDWYSTASKIEEIVVSENNPYIISENGFLYSKDKKTLKNCLFDIEGTFIVPDGVEKIESGAFNGLHFLDELYISDSLSVIEGGAFNDCKTQKITISENNPYFTVSDDVLFSKDMKQLVLFPSGKTGSYTIPDSVEKICNNAFWGAEISNVEFSENITHIGSYAFASCDNIEKFILPPKLKEINDFCFYYYYAWQGERIIILPEGITTIGEYAFSGGSTKIYIPESVTNIAQQSTYDLPRLYVHNNSYAHQFALDNNFDFELVDGMTSTNIMEYFTELAMQPEYLFYPESTGNIESISNIHSDVFEIPQTVGNVTITSVYLEDYTTVDGDPIKKLIIPDTVKIKAHSPKISYEIEIGENNEYMTIVDGVVYSKDMKTLIYCLDKIEGEFTVPEGIEVINDYAFAGQIKLSKLNLPKSLVTFSAFSFTNALIYDITIDEGNKYFTVVDNAILSKDMDTLLYCPEYRKGTYTIPDSVDQIGSYAFLGSSLSEIIIPDSVITIDDYAFYYCSSITDIILPDSVTSVGSNAFFGCYSLQSIELSDNITKIPECAFANTGLKSITIPPSVTTIEESAFGICLDLEEVYVPSTVTNMGDYAFDDWVLLRAEYGSAAHDYILIRSNTAIIGGKPVIRMSTLSNYMDVGAQQVPLDTRPAIINDRTMVPVRAIFEALGAQVEWNDAARTITGTKDGITITMQIDSLTMTRNGEELTLDTPPQIVEDRALVPVRAIAESFDCDVHWHDGLQRITIIMK